MPAYTPYGPWSVPQWDWSPPALRGGHGVVAQVLVSRIDVVVVRAEFDEHASLAEHAARRAITVVCLKGAGNASVREEAEVRTIGFSEGQWVTWPHGKLYRLWTEGERMSVLMVEHVPPAEERAAE
jgi:quercetin dioxygenase-like cupin family protein